MTDTIPLPQVGSPDPELNTSPIAEETDEEYDVVKQEIPGEPICYFNNQQFKNGHCQKGSFEVLRGKRHWFITHPGWAVKL